MTMRSVRFVAIFGVALCFIGTLALIGSTAQAAIRSVFTPGDASVFIWIQGISAGQPADMDPRALYEALAVEPTNVSGGKGKGIKTADGNFTLSCVAREALPEDVLCSIVLKKSSWTSVSSRNQSAQALMNGGEAGTLHEKFAGPNSSVLWTYSTSDRRVQITSSPSGFLFDFNQKP